MAAGDRTDRITDRIMLLLGLEDKKVTDKVSKALIYSYLDDAQAEVAERLLCIESSATLVVSASAVAEPTGFYRMKLIALATGTVIQPEEISIVDYDAYTRYSLSAPSGGMYYKRWGGTITFYPTLSAGSYTCYFYKTPSTNVSTIIDPETPSRFDNLLENYALYHLAPFANKPDFVGLYKKLYDEEFKDAIESQRRTKPGHYTIEYHDV